MCTSGLRRPRAHAKRSDGLVVSDPLPHDRHALSQQEGTFQGLIASVAAKASAGGDHPVARDVRAVAVAHDVPDGSRRPRSTRERGNLAVRSDAPGWNPPDRHQHACREVRFHRVERARSMATEIARPSAAGNEMPEIEASVGATSAGVTASAYVPGLMP